MDFKSALNRICADFKKEILFERRVISILDDYGAFNDIPYYKLFYKTALSSGNLITLISVNDNDREKARYTFVSMNGLDDSKVKAFLSIISECYHIPQNDSENIDFNTTPSHNEISINPNNSNNGPKIRNAHLDFWGIPLGNPVNDFDKLLKAKGYGASKYNNPDEKMIRYGAYGRTEMFIGYGSSVTLYESPYTGLVYKVEVYLSKMITKSIVIYNELYPLLIQKYGKPNRDDNAQNCRDKEGKGITFIIPEGTISLTFGKFYTGDNALYLIYEDKATVDSIAHELPLYETEMKRKKDKEDQDYKNKLISDL